MFAFISLISAVAASLAGGVLLAHALCVSMFRLLRIHSTQIALRKTTPSLTTISN